MAQTCEHASSCGKESCQGCEHATHDFSEKPHDLSQIKKVIGVVSGKGGVGKSLVTSLLAVTMNRLGYRTAILDADITGPSIPKAFGITEKAVGDESGIYPVASKNGVKVMSLNLLLENETDPVVWRGPVIAGTVKQFWTDVIWGDIDYMFIDMPPGTGDVPLTVFQSIAVDGIVVVTSPQELVSMIVEKAVRMAQLMNIPILGLVENLSYFTCPDNGKDYAVFGDSHIDEIAAGYNLPVLARLPIDPALAAACDAGTIESLKADWFSDVAQRLTAEK
ncbi:MAG: Mrp/NBP35 family ATP-binding protein [Ruminococcaceae bacterium]|nr:Mrp/NBP35 family ATP-binding protein [Oscillospiraceae bacterium]